MLIPKRFPTIVTNIFDALMHYIIMYLQIPLTSKRFLTKLTNKIPYALMNSSNMSLQIPPHTEIFLTKLTNKVLTALM